MSSHRDSGDASKSHHNKWPFRQPGSGRKLFDQLTEKLIKGLVHHEKDDIGTTMYELSKYLRDIGLPDILDVSTKPRVALNVKQIQCKLSL